jgi:hypothetical protein
MGADHAHQAGQQSKVTADVYSRTKRHLQLNQAFE